MTAEQYTICQKNTCSVKREHGRDARSIFSPKSASNMYISIFKNLETLRRIPPDVPKIEMLKRLPSLAFK